MNQTPPSREGPRINNKIAVASVFLIGPEGDKIGEVPLEKAIIMAGEYGLDLVEISPNASPPVCKILDYGKYKYEQQKKANEARKKQKIIEVKEIKMRPNIDTHDYDVKMRAVEKFIGNGDKVKITMRFRGREMTHLELGMALLKKIESQMEEITKLEAEPKMEGRQMIMLLAPK